MKFFRLRSWSKYQHYKDRNPQWVKLYATWLDDYDWSQWSDASKLLAVCIVMLAGRTSNRIPLDPKWIQQRCGLTKIPDLQPLFDAGFIETEQPLRPPEQGASTALSDCKQEASGALPLARSREESREEESREDGASAPVAGLDSKSWERWVSYRIEIRKPLRSASLAAAQKALAAFGAAQAAVVEQSIAQGWSGLFPLKDSPKKPGNGPEMMFGGKPVEWQ